MPPATEQGSTLLCLHDAGGNGNEFAGLLDALADKHSPIAYDQPGHGRSGSLDSLGSIPAMAAHVRDLAGAMSLDPPVLVGEGMGAAVAIEAAADGWPAALVLVGGAATSFDLDETIDKLGQITAGKARREFDSTGYAPDTDRSVYQKAFGEWVKTDPRATLGDRLGQADWDGAAAAAKVSCPVLIVVGEHEDDAAKATATALSDALSNSKVTELGGAARRGIFEQPADLGQLIDSFVGEL